MKKLVVFVFLGVFLIGMIGVVSAGFGGMYTVDYDDGDCLYTNVATGECSCLPGYDSAQVRGAGSPGAFFADGTRVRDHNTTLCYNDGEGEYSFGGMYGYSFLTLDHITGTPCGTFFPEICTSALVSNRDGGDKFCSCPDGFTASQITGSSEQSTWGVGEDLVSYYCYAPLIEGDVFGGLYSTLSTSLSVNPLGLYKNPVTDERNCPFGYDRSWILDTCNHDNGIRYCMPSCSPDQVIMKLSDLMDARGAFWNDTSYTHNICCDEVFGVGADECNVSLMSDANSHLCDSNKVLGLSEITDALAQNPTSVDYSNEVCYGDLSCRVVDEGGGDYCNYSIGEKETVSLLTETASNVADPNYLPSGVVGYWKLDGNVDGVVGSDGTWSGGDETYVDGQIRRGLDFDGVDDYVNISDSDDFDFGTDDFSIEFWVKQQLPAGSDFMEYISKRETCFWEPFFDIRGTHDDEGNNDKISMELNDKDYRVSVHSGPINDNQWHHLVFMRDGAYSKAFTDGVLVSSSELEGNLEIRVGTNPGLPATLGSISNDIPVRIGGGPCTPTGGSGDGTLVLNGSLDEVVIYNRALTDEEVQGRYNVGAYEKKVCCKLSSVAPVVLFWEDMDGNLITETNIGNQVRMVRTGEASGDFEIFNDDDKDIRVGDDKIQGVEDDGNLVGVWTITQADFDLGIADDDYIEAVFKIDGEPSGVLKVLEDWDDEPMVVTLEAPLCAEYFEKGDPTTITVNASDPNYKIIGNISIDGVNIMNFSNEVKSTLYKWDRAGNVQVELFAVNSKGYLRRTITSVMVVELDVERDYVAACISKPVDFSDITSRKVEFDASNSKGLRCGADDSKIEDCGAVYAKDLWFSWRFSDGLINSNHEGSNELSYAFFKNFATAGHNWAILDVEMR